MTLADRDWLRRVIEDTPATTVETATASGTDSEFYVRNPPITGSVFVTVDGTTETAFTVVDDRLIRLTDPPAAHADVTIRYDRQTFTDADLDHYLADAARDYAEPRQRVYRAAVLALDTLLTGTASAVNFGAGAETYDMNSVFERLTRVRAQLAADTYPRPAVYVPPVLPPVL